MTGDAERWARGRWNVLRKRRPRITRAVEAGVLGIRGAAALADEVRALRNRVAELERDHALIAAHVAALTEAVPGEARPAPSVEAVRLAAVAFYEHRITALEARAGLRHARDAVTRTTRRGTSRDGTENG
ncbi:MAG TPA: hypothetical protein VIG76_03035 [Amnibacterium sp.]|uniref:hypothetical protein n=1 Tax=Amnibacterium sp. TaxID=1872496 RepID=UPI002F953C2E